jgi:hypothetical protein
MKYRGVTGTGIFGIEIGLSTEECLMRQIPSQFKVALDRNASRLK